ncbi:MAG: hypothetical protein K0S18_588 [Anaerocolumna sp.]|nr:hypothetical protein [Anaerocolumna sp.]
MSKSNNVNTNQSNEKNTNTQNSYRNASTNSIKNKSLACQTLALTRCHFSDKFPWRVMRILPGRLFI